MNLKKRLASIEKTLTAKEEIHFIGWANCRWERAAGLARGDSESKEEFFKRVRSVTNKKWIWCD